MAVAPFSVHCSPGDVPTTCVVGSLRKIPTRQYQASARKKPCKGNVPRGLVEGFKRFVPSRRHADHCLQGFAEGSPRVDCPILIETDRFIAASIMASVVFANSAMTASAVEYSDRRHPQCIRGDRPWQLPVLLYREKPTNQLALFCLPAGAASHPFSFDHRRRPETLRTAIATAFFWPTSTTSCFPRVTPV